ncbi:MAG: DUF3575 domain-containing protein [Bacteroidota bacterium]|nr:DUF3575 domain-containing protein [Bacteroidota bacterium]
MSYLYLIKFDSTGFTMKNTSLIYCVFVFLVFFELHAVKAQDRIILEGKKDTLTVKVTLTDKDQIYYYLWNDLNKEKDSISRIQVFRIIFEDGRVIRYVESRPYRPSYENQRKMAVKWDIFALVYGTYSFSFEKSIGEKKSLEFALGVIYNNFPPKSKGLYMRAGYKIGFTPLRYRNLTKSHILNGWYLRPEVFINSYTQDDFSLYSTDYKYANGQPTFTLNNHYKTYQRKSLALLLNTGKQWVFGNRICIDAFVGFGAGYGSQKMISETNYKTSESGYPSWYYSEKEYIDQTTGTGLIMAHSNNIYLAAQFSIKFGYLFSVN